MAEEEVEVAAMAMVEEEATSEGREGEEETRQVMVWVARETIKGSKRWRQRR